MDKDLEIHEIWTDTQHYVLWIREYVKEGLFALSVSELTGKANGFPVYTNIVDDLMINMEDEPALIEFAAEAKYAKDLQRGLRRIFGKVRAFIARHAQEE